MQKFISVKHLRKACLLRLKTGWEFGVPPGYDRAVEALVDAIKEHWSRSYVEESPTLSQANIVLMYSPIGWSLVTDQTAYGYSLESITIEKLVAMIEDKIGKVETCA